MAKLAVDLQWATPASWVEAGPLLDFDRFLADHANCERKASALALSLVVRFPDREAILRPLIDLAAEELAHFSQVFAVMEARGVALIPDSPDPYIAQMQKTMRHGREERFIDTLLISSLIECRGAERFRLISEAMAGRDRPLQDFYRDLWACEAKHGNLFVEWALHYCAAQPLYARLRELASAEAEIAAALPARAALH